jgi:hypothetical protein
MFKAHQLLGLPKSKKWKRQIEEKKEKMIDNLVMNAKGLDEIKCRHVDDSIRREFLDCFSFGNKHVERLKVHVDRILPPPWRIVYHLLSNTHKNEIRHQILMFHYIDQ